MSQQKTMTVRATARGVHGQLREAGEEFDVLEQHFSGRWMEVVDSGKSQGGSRGSQSGQSRSASE